MNSNTESDIHLRNFSNPTQFVEQLQTCHLPKNVTITEDPGFLFNVWFAESGYWLIVLCLSDSPHISASLFYHTLSSTYNYETDTIQEFVNEIHRLSDLTVTDSLDKYF